MDKMWPGIVGMRGAAEDDLLFVEAHLLSAIVL